MSYSNGDKWLRDYDSLVELGAKIGVKIRERDAGGFGKKVSSTISKLLTEYQQKLQALRTSLNTLSHSISDGEYNRRKTMIEELSEKYQQLSVSRTTGWTTDTTYQSIHLDPWEGGAPGTTPQTLDDIRREQQALISEQDQGLENLSRALRRQQEVGLAMQDEITEHNVLIDEIHDATTKTDDKIRFHTRRVQEARRKQSCKCTCALVSVIALLLLAIIIIIAVPYGGKP